jgi:hypothetical protein
VKRLATALILGLTLMFSCVAAASPSPLPAPPLPAEAIAQAKVILRDMASLGYQMQADMSESDYAKAAVPLYGKARAFADEYGDYMGAYTVSTLGIHLDSIRLEWSIKRGFGSLKPDDPEIWGQGIIDKVKSARRQLTSPPPPSK